MLARKFCRQVLFRTTF